MGACTSSPKVMEEFPVVGDGRDSGNKGKEMAAASPPLSNLSRIGLAGLGVLGENLALNIADKGFPISVYDRSNSKVDETVKRAKQEGNLPVSGFHDDPKAFVESIQKPRVIIMLVKAGPPVDETIKTLCVYLEKGDCIIDGGDEWYENTERRETILMHDLGVFYLGMGISDSGGKKVARHGPSMMPGGSFEAYKYIEDIFSKVAAQVPNSGPCVAYIGKGGSGNFVKMVHNGIEYGDMQLIAEAYDVLKSVGKLSNEGLNHVFSDWNKGELQSFLIKFAADIFLRMKDDDDKAKVVLDKTGMNKEKLIDDVRQALYASKISSYAQGMNLIRSKSIEKGWDIKLGELARIWKGGCSIRAMVLDRIKKAYDRNPDLANLLVDPEFAKEMIERQPAWRRVVCLAINSGIGIPAMSSSLAYFDKYRRETLPADLVQAQRDFFGAHT